MTRSPLACHRWPALKAAVGGRTRSPIARDFAYPAPLVISAQADYLCQPSARPTTTPAAAAAVAMPIVSKTVGSSRPPTTAWADAQHDQERGSQRFRCGLLRVTSIRRGGGHGFRDLTPGLDDQNLDEVTLVARGIATAVAPDTGLTEVQAQLLEAIVSVSIGFSVDYRALEPLGPDELLMS